MFQIFKKKNILTNSDTPKSIRGENAAGSLVQASLELPNCLINFITIFKCIIYYNYYYYFYFIVTKE